jgi:hypothetical protein
VHFHHECLRAGELEFLSDRHSLRAQRATLDPLRPLDLFELFRSTCLKVKRLADRIDRAFFARELRPQWHRTQTKPIDNAIVNFVRNGAGTKLDSVATYST